MRKKYLLYMLFAVISTGVNLGSQYGIKNLLTNIFEFRKTIFFLSKEFEIYFLIQLVTGTVLGFITKFILDKFIVFEEKHKDIKHTLRQIIIYGILAVFTTIVFWGFEFAFKLFFCFTNSELVGGFIGLALGYTIKFFLDKKFVFIKKQNINL